MSSIYVLSSLVTVLVWTAEVLTLQKAMQRTAKTSMGVQPLVSQLTDAIITARLHQPDLHAGSADM